MTVGTFLIWQGEKGVLDLSKFQHRNRAEIRTLIKLKKSLLRRLDALRCARAARLHLPSISPLNLPLNLP